MLKISYDIFFVAEISKSPYHVKNTKNNFGSNNIQKSSILNEESTVMKNTLLPKDKNSDQNKYEMNSRTSNVLTNCSFLLITIFLDTKVLIF